MNRTAHFADRGKYTDVNYAPNDTDRQQSIMVTDHFWMEFNGDRKQMPPPLQFSYVGKQPLHEALPKAEYLGTGECLGRECDVFLFPKVGRSATQDQVFTLDKITSIPLKVETYRDEAARDQKQPSLVWVAKSLGAFQGRDFPIKSTMTLKQANTDTGYIWDFEVTKLKFNDEIPASFFTPVRQPGVIVSDSLTNQTYQEPGALAAASANPPVALAPGQAIQAIPPRDWSTVWSGGSLILGAILIIAAIVTRWRRR